jgi:hypothetical protein
MVKKILALLVIGLMFCSSAYAVTCLNKNIMDTTFNNVTTAKDSDTVTALGYNKIAFFVVYDETEVGNSISAAITCEISYDGTNWQSASFYDYAGGATLQTSETISADGRYYFWFNKDLCVPYVHVHVAATNTDVDDIVNVKVYAVAQE